MAWLQAPLKWSAQSAAAANQEVKKGGVDTWEEEGAEIGASRAHEARQHAEGRLLRQVHQDDARHKGHALTVRHLPTPPTRLESIACPACLLAQLFTLQTNLCVCDMTAPANLQREDEAGLLL